MTTKAEQLVSAIHGLLTVPTEVVPGATWRSRLKKIPVNKSLAVVVRRGLDRRLEDTTLSRHFRLLNVSVEIYARGDEPDLLADPVITEVTNRIMADTTLNGLCDDIEIEAVSPEWETADTDLVAMDVVFVVKYESENNAL